MDNPNMSGGEYATMPEWDMKSILINQYSIAYNCLSEYILEPHKQGLQIDAKKALLKLMYPLFPKLYVLGKTWSKERDYIAYFMRYPDKIGVMECQATFLILQKVMERLGITKFERYQLPQTQAHEEE